MGERLSHSSIALIEQCRWPQAHYVRTAFFSSENKDSQTGGEKGPDLSEAGNEKTPEAGDVDPPLKRASSFPDTYR